MMKLKIEVFLVSSQLYYDSVVVVDVIVASPVTTYTSHSLPKKYVMVRYFDGSILSLTTTSQPSQLLLLAQSSFVSLICLAGNQITHTFGVYSWIFKSALYQNFWIILDIEHVRKVQNFNFISQLWFGFIFNFKTRYSISKYKT